MPTPEEILTYLSLASRNAMPLAAVWHGVMIILGLFWFRGWRPTVGTMRLFLALPLMSVGIVAFAFRNPFNGIVFAFTALVVFLVRSQTSIATKTTRTPLVKMGGIVLVIFGLVYPHFLDQSPWFYYLWGAPVGAIPCPTLSLVMGVALGLQPHLGRIAQYTLAIVGIFYGLFGMFRLGVWMDGLLLAGALVYLWQITTNHRAMVRGNQDSHV